MPGLKSRPISEATTMLRNDTQRTGNDEREMRGFFAPLRMTGVRAGTILEAQLAAEVVTA